MAKKAKKDAAGATPAKPKIKSDAKRSESKKEGVPGKKLLKKHAKFEKKLAKAEQKLKKRVAKLEKTKGALPGPAPVNTGAGATPAELGAALVAAFNEGRGEAFVGRVWSDDIESVEGHGVNLSWFGREAVERKNAEWMAQNRVLGGAAEGPFVGSTGFAVKFRIETQSVETGERRVMDEIGFYTVRDGKIVREEFMYGI